MPRQPKWIAAGIYQPTYQPRHAYGPRRWGRSELLEEVTQHGAGCEVVDAGRAWRDCQRLHGEWVPTNFAAIPMPRGGVRWLLICPRCQSRAARLYGRYHTSYRRLVYACRACWGLRYQSQYAGRRLEAHPDYLQRKMQRQITRTPHDVRADPFATPRRRAAMPTRQRRMARYSAAQERASARTYRYLERCEIAHNLALCILLARGEAEHRRKWRKIVNQVLWHQNAETMRALFDDDNTPDWVCEAFAAALKVVSDATNATHPSAKQRAEVRKAAKTAVETDEIAQFEALIDAARIERLRAEYAALGQARRAKRAA